jgi:pimeloyl-ACP methyl ester carboxylesterase
MDFFGEWICVIKKILLGVVLIVILAAAGFFVWGSTPAAPMDEADAALESDSLVTVRTEPWLVFEPAGQTPQVGFVYYPGGRVDYRAYAPFARALSEQGFLVVVVPMPLNLAVLSPDSAGGVIQRFSQIRVWAVGGHSLGGAMAARYAYQNPDQVDGLVLIASYPADTDRLNDTGVQVLSIYGTEDGLATKDKIEASRDLLPADTRYYPIEGGNHAQFGWYGAQSGDLPAAITRSEQHKQAVAAAAEFLAQLANSEEQRR